MATIVLGLRVGLAAVFLAAGIGKLLDLPGSRRALTDFGVPERATRAASILLPATEIAVAVALIFRPSARWGAVAALLLLAAFIVGIGRALARGEEPDCHCFGQIHSAPAGPLTLARNALLAAFAVVILAYGSGPAVDTWVSARSASVLVAVGVGIFALAAVAYALTTRRELSRLRRDLEIARKAAVGRFGLPVGSDAPSFGLGDLRGETVTLTDLRQRGQPLLLVFMAPGCGPCLALASKVHQWQRTLSARLTIAVITTGAPEHNAALAEEGLEDVLLQEGTEVNDMYGIRVTPSAVSISSEGRIASAIGESEFGIEPLLRLALRDRIGAARNGSPGPVPSDESVRV